MRKSNENEENLEFIKKSEVYYPLFTGRPERDEVVTEDEILNLVIALNTCSSADEFMKLI